MKYKTETVIEAIRLKEAGVTTSAISKKLLAPTSTINEWLKKAKQNNLTAENLRTLSEQDIEEILRPRSWFRQNVFLPDYEDLLVKASAPKMTVQNCYATAQNSRLTTIFWTHQYPLRTGKGSKECQLKQNPRPLMIYSKEVQRKCQMSDLN